MDNSDISMHRLVAKNPRFNLAFWAIFFILMFLGLSFAYTVSQALLVSALMVLPTILPVYIHEIIFEQLLLKKKILIYFLLLAAIVIVFGYLGILALRYFGPSDVNTMYYVNILSIILVYSWSKKIRIGTLQRIRLKEEEALRIKTQLDLKEMEAEKSRAELDLLKTQLNPHFLFNSLNCIYSLSLDHSPKTSEAILHLSDLMRYQIDSSKRDIVSLKDEIEFIQNYISLEKLRSDNNCKIEFRMSGILDGKFIAPMLIFPFIENSIKHGISKTSSNNHISVELSVEGMKIRGEISNQIAPKRNDQLPGTGTGIANLHRRLELLYPGKHKLLIENDGVRYIVTFDIEL
ncbi:MAG: histidine kinase [Bacteroidia bacterium]|nr:histidine kinase [Bacteroidia bacterium]